MLLLAPLVGVIADWVAMPVAAVGLLLVDARVALGPGVLGASVPKVLGAGPGGAVAVAAGGVVGAVARAAAGVVAAGPMVVAAGMALWAAAGGGAYSVAPATSKQATIDLVRSVKPRVVLASIRRSQPPG